MGSARIQGQLWGGAAGDWVDLQEPQHLPLWRAMLDGARVGAGTRVLDAGCGGGGASELAAARGARVTGFDACEPLLEIARARVPSGDLHLGDLEALPFADGEFDAVIAANSIQYAANAVVALRELRRVCTAWGRVAVSVWGAPEDCEQRVIFSAVRDVLQSPPPVEDPFALSTSGALERLMVEAGLEPIGWGEVYGPFIYRDVEAMWRAQRAAGPLQAALRVVREDRLEAAVVDAVRPHRRPDGSVVLHNAFRFVTARPAPRSVPVWEAELATGGSVR